MRALLFGLAILLITAVGAFVFVLMQDEEPLVLDGVDVEASEEDQSQGPSRREDFESNVEREESSAATPSAEPAAAPKSLDAPRPKTGRTITLTLERDDRRPEVLPARANVHLYFVDDGLRLVLEDLEVPGTVEVEDAPWGQVHAGVDHPTWDLRTVPSEIYGTINPRELMPDEKRGDEIRLRLVPRRKLTGVCIDEGGAVVEGVALRAKVVFAGPIGQGRWRGDAQSGSDGRFTLPDLPGVATNLLSADGRWWIQDVQPWISKFEKDPLPFLAIHRLPVGTEIPDLVLTVTKGRSVEGRVVDHQGASLPGVTIRANDQRAANWLRELGRASAFHGVIESTTTKRDGRFRLEDLPPLADLRLEVQVGAARVVRSVCDLKDGNRDNVEIVVPRAFAPKLRFTGVSATRLDGEEVFVSWAPPLRQRHERGQSLVMKLDAAGEVQLPPLAPGRLTVSFRLPDTRRSTKSEPAFHFSGPKDAVQTLRRVVDLQGDEEFIELALREPAILSGRILLPALKPGSDGLPPASRTYIRLARVASPRPLRVGGDSADLQVDADGRFRIRVDAPGRYCLTGVKQLGGVMLGRADSARIVGSPFISTERVDNLLEVR